MEQIIDLIIGLIMLVAGSIPFVSRSDSNNKGLSNAMFYGGGIMLLVGGVIYIILTLTS